MFNLGIREVLLDGVMTELRLERCAECRESRGEAFQRDGHGSPSMSVVDNYSHGRGGRVFPGKAFGFAGNRRELLKISK